MTLDLTIETTPVAGAVDNGDGTLSATGTGMNQWIELQGDENGLYFIDVESIDGNTKTLRIVKQYN